MKTLGRSWTVLSGLAVIVAGMAPAAVLAEAPGNHGVEVSSAVRHDVSPPLRDIHVSAPSAANQTERPLLRLNPGQGQADAAVQTTTGPDVAISGGTGFAGVGRGFPGFSVLYAPPDTNGAVGATQYVQWVNTYFAVFNKSTHATELLAPGNTPWAGFGGGCQTNNDGDPIVQYDKIANRWILTQFSVSTTPYMQCVAVSTTSDALGSYNRYAFTYNQFPDYPKLGVWPDAYYISFNMFTSTFQGSRVCAYDRAAMLTGATATQQCFQLPNNYGGLLPSDLDGASSTLGGPGSTSSSGLPPAGSPNYFVAFGSNSLQVWKFHVDWANSNNTTFTGPTTLGVATFSAACNGGGTCIPQKGTSEKLDSLGDRLMYRLAYRHFADGHAALVVNHSVSVGGVASVRWYELDIASGSSNPTVAQQGTLSAADGLYRWMGSIAMDKDGNIALGYSESSSAINPAIALTGRLATDQLNTMQTETILKAGTGSQTRNLSRWGDYSAMSVDPVDDCTFWYTTEYLTSNGTWNWSTWITPFSFPSCGSGGPTTGTISGTVTAASGGAAISGATVSTSTGGYSTTTDGNGHYSLTVAGDTYDVTASAGGYNDSTITGVVVTNGQDTPEDFVLTASGPTTGTISGTVTDQSTTLAIGGATVTVSGFGSTLTDGSGNYSFSNVPPGTYSVTASAAGYTDNTVSGVGVTAGVTSIVDIALSPSGGGSATVPDQPAAPFADNSHGKGIAVSWSAPYDGGSTILGYNVYRYLSCTGSPTLITSTNTNLKDTSTSKGSSYCYRVEAVNAVGTSLVSDPSNTVQALK
jgi:hypothetical protein